VCVVFVCVRKNHISLFYKTRNRILQEEESLSVFIPFFNRKLV